jgi:hypothetical protein
MIKKKKELMTIMFQKHNKITNNYINIINHNNKIKIIHIIGILLTTNDD